MISHRQAAFSCTSRPVKLMQMPEEAYSTLTILKPHHATTAASRDADNDTPSYCQLPYEVRMQQNIPFLTEKSSSLCFEIAPKRTTSNLRSIPSLQTLDTLPHQLVPRILEPSCKKCSPFSFFQGGECTIRKRQADRPFPLLRAALRYGSRVSACKSGFVKNTTTTP